MAKGEYKRKTIHYRKAKFLNDQPETFQALLAAAFIKKGSVKGRMEKLNTDDATHRFVNSHESMLSMYFGNCMLLSEGTHKALVWMELEKDKLTLEQIAPPKIGNRKGEFLDTILYFGVKDNHAVVVQSSALSIQDLENHLNWLLWDSGVLSKDNRVVFAKEIQKATKKRLEKVNVKSVRIGRELETKEVSPISTKGAKVNVKKARFVAGDGFEILSSVLGQDWRSKLKFDENLNESKLEVSVEVSYKYKTTEEAQTFLNDIAIALRDIDSNQVEIDTSEGKIKGSDLWIVEALNIRTYGGVVDESDLYPKMRDFLVSKFDAGIIDP